MRKRRKAEIAEMARLGQATTRLEVELSGVAAEARHTQALHDEFRTAAFAVWSTEVERLTAEFGERFSSAFEGIRELQGLSTALQGQVEAVATDLARTGSDVSALSGRLGLAATAEQMASAFEGIGELQGLSTALQGQVEAVATDLARTGSDVSALSGRLGLAATAEQMASAFEGIEELQLLSSGLQGQVEAVATDLERTGSDVSALTKDMEAVGGLTKDVSALSGRLGLAATAEQMASAFEGIEELQLLSSGLLGQVEAVATDLARTGSDVSALTKDMGAVGGLTKDVSALTKDMEAVGGLTKDVSALTKDMEAVGGLTKDVSAMAAQSEKEQGRLSETVATVADQVTRVDTLAAGLAAIQRSLAAVTAVSAPAGQPGATPKSDVEPVTEVPLDRLAAETVYAAIEDRFRGSPEAIREQQSNYLDLIKKLPGSKPVVDLGCGRGEFLSLLAESDIAGVGVDLSSAFVAECQEQGLNVTEQDLLAFLGSQKDKSLRGVVSFQVLEHLPFPVLLRTYAEAFRVLVPGGLFLNETPNGANLAVGGSTFWLDHTHVRPLHPELLSHFAKFYGYTDIRVDLVSKPEVSWKLGPDASGEAVGDAVLGLQEYVLAGQDALLVAYRPKEPRKPRTSKASTTRAKRSS